MINCWIKQNLFSWRKFILRIVCFMGQFYLSAFHLYVVKRKNETKILIKTKITQTLCVFFFYRSCNFPVSCWENLKCLAFKCLFIFWPQINPTPTTHTVDILYLFFVFMQCFLFKNSNIHTCRSWIFPNFVIQMKCVALHCFILDCFSSLIFTKTIYVS